MEMEKIADLIKQVVVHAVETTMQQHQQHLMEMQRHMMEIQQHLLVMQQSQGLAAVAPCGPEAVPPLGAAAGCSWAGPRLGSRVKTAITRESTPKAGAIAPRGGRSEASAVGCTGGFPTGACGPAAASSPQASAAAPEPVVVPPQLPAA